VCLVKPGEGPGRVTVTAPAIRALLAVHAAARERTADDHMFTVSRGGELAGAFRLGGDVEQAWDFGLDRILTAVRAGAAR